MRELEILKDKVDLNVCSLMLLAIAHRMCRNVGEVAKMFFISGVFFYKKTRIKVQENNVKVHKKESGLYINENVNVQKSEDAFIHLYMYLTYR